MAVRGPLVENRFVSAAQHACEQRREGHRVLDARVHALAAGRAVHVRRVAAKQDAVKWAQRYKDESHRGAPPKRVDDVLKTGDVVRVARNAEGKWKLSQIPGAQGALISLDPEDGARLVNGILGKIQREEAA